MMQLVALALQLAGLVTSSSEHGAKLEAISSLIWFGWPLVFIGFALQYCARREAWAKLGFLLVAINIFLGVFLVLSELHGRNAHQAPYLYSP